MDIKNLHQVGEKTSKILNKLGIFTDDDLINYYPYRYNVYNFSNELIDNSTLIINVIIESNPIVSYIKKNFNRLSFRARYNEKIFNVVIFNRAYLKTNLTIGKNITIIGKYDFKKNIFTSSDIKFNVTNGQIEPVYHLTKGITNNTISKLIKDNFNNIYIKDSLPSNIISKYNLLSKKDALYNIHFANDLKMVHYAKNRLIYEELFDFSFKMNYFKNQNIRKDKEPKNIDINKINEYLDIDFKATINIIFDIFYDSILISSYDEINLILYNIEEIIDNQSTDNYKIINNKVREVNYKLSKLNINSTVFKSFSLNIK